MNNKRGNKLQLLKNESKILNERGDFVLEKRDKGYFFHKAQPDLRKIYIEVTTCCNLDCIICIRNNWEEEKGNMSLELYSKIIEELNSMPKLKEIILGGFGEPLFHPQITEMIKLAKKMGHRVKITTNGMMLKEDLIEELIELNTDELIVSIDSFDKKEFKDIREGGELGRILNNLQILKKKKEKRDTIFPRVSLEFVLMKSNKNQLSQLSKYARELGIISILVTNLLPYTEDMTREILYGKEKSDLEIPIQFWATPIKGLSTMCTVNLPSMNWGADRQCDFIENDACVVTRTGEVAPCYGLMHSYDYYIFNRRKEVSSYSFGSIKARSLYDIWNSPSYLKFRRRVRNFSFPSCEDCQLKDNCTYTQQNEDCWGNKPSCADCLWAQGIVRCP